MLRRNFSFAARYSLKFTRCSLLVAKFAHYSLQKLLAAEIQSLLVAKSARYSLQKLVAANIDSLFVAKFARYSLLKLLVAKKSLITRCEIRLLLVAKNHSFLVAKNHSPLVKTITS